MSTVGLDSQEDMSVTKSVQICEDPNSKAHLDSLFDVLNNSQPPVKEGKKQLEPIPMIKRNFPDSFFNPSKDRGGMRRLGPSISVGTTPGFGVQHNRSVSMPASFNDAHPRQFSLDSSVHGPIPPGWEESQTPDGLSYFIDHNTKTTTWEDPRKVMSHMTRGTPLQSHHLPMPPYPQPAPHMQQPIPQPQQTTGSNQAVDSLPLPEGWQKAFTAEGETYYVNHKNRTTSWFHPALPQHHHSHSFAGVPRAMGHGFPAYPPHSGGIGGVQDMQRLPYEARQHDHILQQHHNVMEAGRAPGALYSDPYLSSNNHIRQASHDSGLGVTAMPYQDVGMDFEEGMDTTHSSINKVPLNQEYMPNTDIDTDALQTDPHMQEQMEGELLGGRWV